MAVTAEKLRKFVKEAQDSGFHKNDDEVFRAVALELRIPVDYVRKYSEGLGLMQNAGNVSKSKLDNVADLVKAPARRGKKATFDYAEAVKIAKQVEEETQFKSRSELFAAVAERVGTSAPNIANALKKHNFEFKTPKGKRGGDGTFGGKRGLNRGQRKTKVYLSDDAISDTISRMGDIPVVINTLDKAARGNRNALQKVGCWACTLAGPKNSGWKASIKFCQVARCVGFANRPYQDEKSDEVNEIAEAAEPDVIQIGNLS